jgi:hypothetical protein
MRRSIFVLVILAGGASLTFGQQTITPHDFKGRLFAPILWAAPSSFKVTDLDQDSYAALPHDLKKRLLELEARYTRFRSRLPRSKERDRLPEFEHMKVVERAIVSLVNVPGIEDLAARYATQATIFYEWEGMSGAPLNEAGYAEVYLTGHPKSVLKPYLLLFLLHRYRCAFECLVWEGKKEEAKETATKYRSILKRARNYPDPLVGLIAEDLDLQQKNIYMESKLTGRNIHP